MALDGRSDRMNGNQFLAAIISRYGLDAEIPITVLRGGERIDLSWPKQKQK